MNVLDLIAEIHKYCSQNGIKTTETTVSELTNHMIIQSTSEIWENK